MNYKPEDFSPIFGPNEKPTRKGLYVTTLHLRRHGAFTVAHKENGWLEVFVSPFQWWDGKVFLYAEGGDVCEFDTEGCYWFGLAKNPRKGK